MHATAKSAPHHSQPRADDSKILARSQHSLTTKHYYGTGLDFTRATIKEQKNIAEV
jgi:hypothetical protein